ncbi:DUF4469 domain-containing protein [Leadbettera azotonutricia]|uniref:Uncharacterized protein n=1 Tax=Leadbettera azotonutricia (strain ATCC BAA-888 / DSM 13862 / ZAS-9) TaxID=545695 RepID=F5YFL1_LEAAZ|nr:DUF4469 domain-containing protein [Leadbettera azotonutricia]AEF81976.1 conserved hypothetical protein [Leadbettera azotonutricia ZAS-9]
MSNLQKPQNVLHTIKAKLYPNYLKEASGKYIARAKAEMPLSVEDVCASATSRGGSGMNCNTMIAAVKAYFSEAAYMLADGFAVKNDYYSIHPKIGGTFESERGSPDAKRNKINFRFRRLKGFKDIIEMTTVQIEGLASPDVHIGEVLDITTGLKDGTLSPGGMVMLRGRRIKIVGSNPACGLYLVNTADGKKTRVTTNFATNVSTKLVFQMPVLKKGVYHIEVVTQFTGHTELKDPRIIACLTDLKVN